MCTCDQVIQPDEKLKRMLTLVKIILIIHLLSMFARIGIGDPGDMFEDLLCLLFLFLAYKTVYFMYMAIYDIFCLFISFYLFIRVGGIIQKVLQHTTLNEKDTVSLAFTLYLFIFYVFAIILTFPIYKEMKAQAMESFSGGSAYRAIVEERSRQDNNDRERPTQQTQSQQQSGSRGFQAFSGRGVQVGGN